MRILVTSDWHLDWTTAGLPRWRDLEIAVLETVDAAVGRGCQLYVFCGDLCDPDGPSAIRAMGFAIRVAERLLDAGIPSMWLVGNHDVVEDGHGTSTLSPLKEVLRKEVHVFDVPSFLTFFSGGEGVQIVGLPYPSWSEAKRYHPQEFIDSFVRTGQHSNLPVVVFSHLNVEGIEPGSETHELPRGREVMLPAEAIRERWPNALIVNGHYHRRQHYERLGVWVPGSLERLTLGERQNEPGYLILEV